MNPLARLLAALLLALALAGTAAPALAQQSTSRSVDSPRFDVDIQVQDGGALLVMETQQIAFHGGSFRKGSRQISLRDTGGVRDVAVSENGQSYRPGRDSPGTFAVANDPGRNELNVEWWFPDTSNQVRTFVVTYRVDGAVRYYSGGDQVRWNALPQERGYVVVQSTITMRLPRGITPADWKLDAYPGQYLQAKPSGQADVVTWVARNLPASQGFEVRAQWPHGVVTGNPPAWQAAADAADQRRENLAPVVTLATGTATLVILLGGGLWLLMLWYTRGRDVPAGSGPRELDAPPSDLPPGLAGTLVDEGADVRDAVATVLDLARRGVIRITEVRDPTLAGTQRDFQVELLEEHTSTLRPFERRVLDTFFKQGSPVRLSQLGDWFHRGIPAIQEAIHEEVAREGLFTDNPDRVRRRYRRSGVFAGAGGLVLALVLGGALGEYSSVAPWPGLALAGAGGVLWLMAGRMPRRTAAGALEASRWKAYARHLEKAQPNAIERVARLRDRDGQSDSDSRAEVFDETLPYAVAFGLERAWVQKFATVGVPAPTWLGMPGGPVIIGGWGPGWGGPYVGPYGGHHRQGGSTTGDGPAAGPVGPDGWNGHASGGAEAASGSLMDLLNRASEVLSHGGGSGWSGGGGGGGWSGGGGGGSGGGGSSFS